MKKSVLILLLGIFLLSFVSFCYAEEGEASVTISSQSSEGDTPSDMAVVGCPSECNCGDGGVIISCDDKGKDYSMLWILLVVVVVIVLYLITNKKDKVKKVKKR